MSRWPVGALDVDGTPVPIVCEGRGVYQDPACWYDVPPVLVEDVTGLSAHRVRAFCGRDGRLNGARHLLRDADGAVQLYAGPGEGSVPQTAADLIGDLSAVASGMMPPLSMTKPIQLARAIPPTVDGLWPDSGDAPTQQTVARELHAWQEGPGQPTRQFREAVRRLGGWQMVIAESRTRRRG